MHDSTLGTNLMADKLQQSRASTPETIPETFVRYLKMTTDDARESVVQAHPQLFTLPVVDALNEARRQFNETMREVKEACQMIDAVSSGLEFTGAPVELQPGEAKALLDEDTFLQNFATSLVALLEAREKNGKALAPTAQSKTMGSTASGSSSTVITSFENGIGKSVQQKEWFAQPALVLAVLSFLPAEDIFMEAENVCRKWQAWLFQPDVSRFFWVGCVQREFPQQLAALLQTEGEDLFESDWRTLAMLCVTEAGDEGEVDNDVAGQVTDSAV